MPKLYLIGSLRNPEVPNVANKIEQETGWEVFDDWYSAGPEADDYWKEHQRLRGRNYEEALRGYAARHVFNFDRHHLDTCDAGLLLLPAGRSGHLELGYLAGRNTPTIILLDQETEDNRWDVMTQFAGLVTNNLDQVYASLQTIKAR